MFIELTTDEGKVMVNTSNVAYINPFYAELRTKTIDGTSIHFVNPINAKSRWAILVKETYEEVKQMIMEGK